MNSLKIIHIVENLDKGAVENWLVNIFLESKKTRPDWQWTFYCILGRKGRLDQKVISAGAKIVYSPVTISDKVEFLRHLRRELKTGAYDIIHAHHDYLSGFYMLASIGVKALKRFLHVHNTDRSLPVGNKMLRGLLLKPFRWAGMMLSDVVVAISADTLTEFVRTDKTRAFKHKILYYGVDMSRFDVQPQQQQVRRDLNLPDNSKILLFAGRMNDLKNPVFVIEILNELLKIRNDVYAVFIGSGDKELETKERASAYNITQHVRIAGWHDNVALLMKASDVFVFPRKEYPKEGLGLVVVEAQAAGLPIFTTNGIVPDAIEVNELVHILAPENPAQWANEISEVLDSRPSISQTEALTIMKSSKFELGNATRNLIELYEH